MVEYQIFEHEMVQYGEKYNTFGIKGMFEGRESIEIHDVSIEKEFVQELVYKLNKNQASIINVYDIVEDLIA